MYKRTIVGIKLGVGAISLLSFGIHHLFVRANPQPSWFEDTVGTYQSEIWNDDSMVPGTTTFTQTADGDIEGSYTIEEADSLVSGTLSDCRHTASYTISCAWEDIYGVGTVTVAFSEDFSGFTGRWRLDDSSVAYQWNGVSGVE